MTMSSDGRPARRVYSAAEKLAVLADAERMGVAAACQKHGVNPSTFHWWRNKRDNGEDLAPKRGVPTSQRDSGSTEPEPKGKRLNPNSHGYWAAKLKEQALLTQNGVTPGNAIQVLPERSNGSHSAQEEMRRLHADNVRLRRVIAVLLGE